MEQNNETQNKILKTYTEDRAEVIGNNTDGLIKKIIHREQEAENEKKNLSPELKKNTLFILISILLISITLSIFSFFIFTKDNSTVQIENQFVPLIFNDKSSLVEVAGLDKDNITQTIFNVTNATQVKEGGMEGIYLTYDKKVVGLRGFIELIKANLVLDDSNGELVNDNFLMGVVNGETKDFFILIKMRSIADIFDSLRTWEKKMFLDMQGFFGLQISPENKYLLTANFEDGIVENKNARILYGEDNKIVMMYIFANETSIIITNTEKTTREIMLRLASSRVKK